MITYIDGDIFESPAKTLVNTVNTKGVMGKGIALEFKRIYPEMFKRYRMHCEKKNLTIGRLYLYKTAHKWILNFPTKEHWRNPSRLEYIESGLQKFVSKYAEMGVTSIAFPQLGCGNGELDFDSQVKPLMEGYLGKLSMPVYIYLRKNLHDVPEHKNVSSVSGWLRSEPSALPFDEVWQDVIEILRQQSEFRTTTKGNMYFAYIDRDLQSISVQSSGKNFRILKEDILVFWQQLRDFGLTYSGIAAEHRHLSYLMPVFEQLPYIHPVRISSSARGLVSNPTQGLQVVPPPLSNQSPIGDLFGNSMDVAQA